MTRRFVLMSCAFVAALSLAVLHQTAAGVLTAQVYTGPGLAGGIDAGSQITGTASGDLPTSIENVIQTVLNYIALAAVIGIIIAGLYMIFTGGAQADRAKQIIIWIVVGLFVVLLAKVIVKTVYFLLQASAPDANVNGLVEGENLILAIVPVVNTVLTYVALAAVVAIIIAGLYMILTGGSQADRAKEIIKWTVIGLFVILLAKVIVMTVYTFLNAGSANTFGVGSGVIIDASNIAVAIVLVVNAVLDYVALFAVIALIVAGLYMILTGGSQADRAKEIIKWVIIGLVVILLAKLIVITIYSFLGAGSPDVVGGDINVLDATSARSTIVSIVNTVLTYVGLAAVIAIVVAGLYLILGFGSESAKDRAKQIVLYTVIGLIIILLAKVIVALPLILLGAS